MSLNITVNGENQQHPIASLIRYSPGVGPTDSLDPSTAPFPINALTRTEAPVEHEGPPTKFSLGLTYGRPDREDSRLLLVIIMTHGNADPMKSGETLPGYYQSRVQAHKSALEQAYANWLQRETNGFSAESKECLLTFHLGLGKLNVSPCRENDEVRQLFQAAHAIAQEVLETDGDAAIPAAASNPHLARGAAAAIENLVAIQLFIYDLVLASCEAGAEETRYLKFRGAYPIGSKVMLKLPTIREEEDGKPFLFNDETGERTYLPIERDGAGREFVTAEGFKFYRQDPGENDGPEPAEDEACNDDGDEVNPTSTVSADQSGDPTPMVVENETVKPVQDESDSPKIDATEAGQVKDQ